MTIRVGVLTILLSTAATPAAAQDSLTLERIFGGGEFRSDLVNVTWLPGRAAYLVREEAAGGGSDVYRVDAASGARELLVRGAELLPLGADQPITIEEMTPSPDGRKLLVYTGSVRVWRRNTKGTYYVWDTATRRLIPVSGRPGYQQFAKFAPAGDAVGFVRDHDLFVTDLVTGQERRLTFDGSETVINGTTDWVYEEELDLRDAFRFSPDGRRIAFWRFDQSAIRPFYLVDETLLYPVLTPVRYPKAGEPN